ncbi:hypothetical protein MNEG_10169 [Monoraphidium neglectum]|uniref:Uncharacterized protein n=1 Tax=Monoraphidium neglectum TaxID=145388 RepID=A0A0D2M2B4_9CHLO|nr:hypothetical protein MNEG_10169 [Monoraphidium neglectum]KIY97794.1 hypothetical protein MNEG_10169 [Monoraphidium neglectum]|eukprot:XP_013896814.1 hypothetical protein MNEG_10169 [Monoraphidium neglectum]
MEASKETTRSLLATTELIQEVLSANRALARCSFPGPWREGHAAALCALAVTVDRSPLTGDDVAALLKGVRASTRRLQRGRAGGAAEAPTIADIVGRKTFAGLDAATAAMLDAAAAPSSLGPLPPGPPCSASWPSSRGG